MFIWNLGPGLLYAGTAVGVSHLVQSTRAAAGIKQRNAVYGCLFEFV